MNSWVRPTQPYSDSTRSGGITTTLISPNNCGSTDAFMVRLTLQAGDQMAEHYHPFTDEHLVVTDGVLTLRLDGEDVTLEPGGAIFIRRGCRHALHNRGSRPVVAVAALAPLAPRPEDGHVETEPVPDPTAAPPQIGGRV